MLAYPTRAIGVHTVISQPSKGVEDSAFHCMRCEGSMKDSTN